MLCSAAEESQCGVAFVSGAAIFVYLMAGYYAMFHLTPFIISSVWNLIKKGA